MIRGVHTMLYTSKPEALRAFLRVVPGDFTIELYQPSYAKG